MEGVSGKSRRTVALLAAFLGIFGIHRLYLGRTGTAIAMMILGISGCSLLAVYFSFTGYRVDLSVYHIEYYMLLAMGIVTFIVVGSWAVVDFIFTVSGRMRDREGLLVRRW